MYAVYEWDGKAVTGTDEKKQLLEQGAEVP